MRYFFELIVAYVRYFERMIDIRKYKYDKAIIRVTGDVDYEAIEEASIIFMKKYMKEKRRVDKSKTKAVEKK